MLAMNERLTRKNQPYYYNNLKSVNVYYTKGNMSHNVRLRRGTCFYDKNKNTIILSLKDMKYKML